jgi:translation initiation factor IF-2
MAAERARWRDVREFLDDLPVRHCQAKPPHELCTICMRINYGIAYDCPLYGRPYNAPAKRPATVGARASEEHVRTNVTSDVAREALRGEEFPVIEFAGPRRPKQSAAPKAKEGDDAPLEVEALEVVAMDEAPAAKAEAPAPAATAPAAPEAASAAMAPPPADAPGEGPGAPTKPPAASGKVDPEELMHRIMEELEIPDEEEAPEAEDEEGPGGKAEGDAPPANAGQEGPSSEGPDEPDAPSSKSRVAEKRIVLRRRKRGG